MFYEYALIGDNLVILFILFLLNARKQLPKLIIVFVIAAFCIKVMLILLLPESLTQFTFPPRQLLHLFFINFIYLIFWALWVYFYYIKKEIDKEYQQKYEKKIKFYGSLLILSNCTISGLQILNTYISFFSFNYFYSVTVVPPFPTVSFSVLSKCIGIIFLLYTYVFITIVINRMLKNIRLFGILFFLLLILFTVQWISHTAVYLGWYENLNTIMAFFSFSYGYAGIGAFLLFGVTLFSHFAAIILNVINRSLNEAGRHKIHLLSLIRCGYLSNVFLGILLVFPFFI